MISCLVIAQLVSAATVVGDRPPPSVQEFNLEVEQAVITGEAWPRNPMLMAARLLQAELPAGFMAGRGSCRSGHGDTVAAVTVRGKEALLGEAPVWLRYNFLCLADSTWRLVDVDTLEAEINSPPLTGLTSLIRPLPQGNASVVEDFDTFHLTSWSRFRLLPIPPMMYPSFIPDSAKDTGIWVYSGPSPYSNMTKAIVAERTASISFVYRDTSGAVVDSLFYEDLDPGWYGIMESSKFPIIQRQVLSIGKIVAEW